MSDKLKGLIVTFETSLPDYHAQHIIDAIQMIKGVANVQVSVDTIDDAINRERVRREIKQRLYDVLQDD